MAIERSLPAAPLSPRRLALQPGEIRLQLLAFLQQRRQSQLFTAIRRLAAQHGGQVRPHRRNDCQIGAVAFKDGVVELVDVHHGPAGVEVADLGADARFQGRAAYAGVIVRVNEPRRPRRPGLGSRP